MKKRDSTQSNYKTQLKYIGRSWGSIMGTGFQAGCNDILERGEFIDLDTPPKYTT